MDYNTYVLELLAEERARERLRSLERPAPAGDSSRVPQGGIKRALAASFVRLGLRLDPAAGEGLGAIDLAAREARQKA